MPRRLPSSARSALADAEKLSNETPRTAAWLLPAPQGKATASQRIPWTLEGHADPPNACPKGCRQLLRDRACRRRNALASRPIDEWNAVSTTADRYLPSALARRLTPKSRIYSEPATARIPTVGQWERGIHRFASRRTRFCRNFIFAPRFPREGLRTSPPARTWMKPNTPFHPGHRLL